MIYDVADKIRVKDVTEKNLIVMECEKKINFSADLSRNCEILNLFGFLILNVSTTDFW